MTKITNVLAKLQAPAAALAIAGAAFLELSGVDVGAPTWLSVALLVVAGALGVPRPSEKAKALADAASK